MADSQILGGIGPGGGGGGNFLNNFDFGGLVHSLGFVVQFILVLVVLGAIVFVGMMMIRYNTRVVVLRQRGQGTEYVFMKAYRNTKKKIYAVKMKGILGPSKNVPLPPSDDLIAKTGKNDIIIMRELANGDLIYCTHPNVEGATFRTLSADYTEFNLADMEATEKRYSKANWVKENLPTMLLIAFCVIFFVLSIMLMDKMQSAINAVNGLTQSAASLHTQTVTA
jgi:hypothetical protein